MSRPSDWGPLGFSTDPVPGDPVMVSARAADYSQVATEISLAATRLREVADGSTHAGEYADALRDRAGTMAASILAVEAPYRRVSVAVETYSYHLRNAQDDSLAAWSAANHHLEFLPEQMRRHQRYTDDLMEPGLTEDDRFTLLRLRDAVEADIAAVHAAVDQHRVALQSAIDRRDGAAHEAIATFDEIQGSGGLTDTAWQNWVQWWEDNDEMVDFVVGIIGVVAAALALVALLIPGINLVVLAIAAAIAISTSIANAACQASAGTKSPTEAIVSVGLTLLPFGAGKVGSLLANSGLTIVAGAAATSLRTSKAAAGISGWTQKRASAYVEDAVTVGREWFVRTFAGDAAALARVRALTQLGVLKGGTPSPAVQAVASTQIWKFYVAAAPTAMGSFTLAVDQAMQAGSKMSTEVAK